MKRLGLVSLVIAVALVANPAVGDTDTYNDGQDTRKSALDIKEVRHSHDGNHLVHRVKTYDEWQSNDLKNRAIYITFDLPDSGGFINFFYVYIAYKNGDLKAKLYDNSGDPPRFVDNVTVRRPNDKAVEVEFKKCKLDSNLERYQWTAHTNDEASSGCGAGCNDFEPNNGSITHKDL